MTTDDDPGAPISYLVLAEGTRVVASDGMEVGSVKRVLADEGADLFDGIVVDTDEGERFVDAPEVAALHERRVTLTLDADGVRALSEPSASPAVIDVDPDDIAGGRGGTSALRRVWNRLSGNY